MATALFLLAVCAGVAALGAAIDRGERLWLTLAVILLAIIEIAERVPGLH